MGLWRCLIWFSAFLLSILCELISLYIVSSNPYSPLSTFRTTRWIVAFLTHSKSQPRSRKYEWLVHPNAVHTLGNLLASGPHLNHAYPRFIRPVLLQPCNHYLQHQAVLSCSRRVELCQRPIMFTRSSKRTIRKAPGYPGWWASRAWHTEWVASFPYSST